MPSSRREPDAYRPAAHRRPHRCSGCWFSYRLAVDPSGAAADASSASSIPPYLWRLVPRVSPPCSTKSTLCHLQERTWNAQLIGSGQIRNVIHNLNPVVLGTFRLNRLSRPRFASETVVSGGLVAELAVVANFENGKNHGAIFAGPFELRLRSAAAVCHLNRLRRSRHCRRPQFRCEFQRDKAGSRCRDMRTAEKSRTDPSKSTCCWICAGEPGRDSAGSK